MDYMFLFLSDKRSRQERGTLIRAAGQKSISVDKKGHSIN